MATETRHQKMLGHLQRAAAALETHIALTSSIVGAHLEHRDADTVSSGNDTIEGTP